MHGSILRRTPLRFMLTVLFAFCLAATAFAAEYANDPFVVTVPKEGDKDQQQDINVGTLQDRLTELGYYEGSKTFVYDMATQYAVRRFCMNNGLTYNERGVRQSVWDAIMDAGANPARDTAEYANLSPGDTGEAVLALQTRLKALNYFTGLVLTPEVFDKDTQTAVERFCETNSVAYEGSGASAALQRIIFSDGAAGYTAPAEKKPFSQKLSDYMMRDVQITTMVLPMFVVWLIVAVLVILIAAVMIHFFIREGKSRKAAVAISPASFPRGMFDAGQDEQFRGVPTMRSIDFQIEYKGQVKNKQLACFDTLSIGRGAVDLQLDAADHLVSHSHCDLSYDGAVLVLNDHSKNGTRINGNLIHKCRCRVNSGDKIVIGSHTISVFF
ncbi:MAG: peptidoglycan-binding protein [Oscillospiraceae bacterium]|nr:peptidoglycan-binding protein [Oscillospiraceae bacterium]